MFQSFTGRRLLALAVVSLATSSAFAACRSSDAWHGNDKQLHFGGGAAIAAYVGLASADPWRGFWVASALGLAKEVADSAGMGECSAKDLLVTMAGAALGASGSGLVLGRNFVGYRREF